MTETTTDWTDTVADFVAATGARGGLLLVFPEYRPDLAKAAAHRLGLRFFDYRAQEMSPLGTKAGSISLTSLDETLNDLARGGGALAFNVEALLATKEPEERRDWIERFVRTDWPSLIVLPITLFAEDTNALTSRILRFQEEDLPDQGLISRLMH
ncbi:MAG: hypothetical protein U9Q81_05395 [Pseudomonadota bacterium]|nr:hypothetical protein [Pseudomonadota bacterium]